jgi:hypothetical protein
MGRQTVILRQMWTGVVIAGVSGCAQHQPAPISNLAGTCWAFEHPAQTDTILLDSLPPSREAWRREPAGVGRILVYPRLVDTLATSERDTLGELEFTWRQAGDSLVLAWFNGITPVYTLTTWSDSAFDAESILFSDNSRMPVETLAVHFVRLSCPAHWRAAS